MLCFTRYRSLQTVPSTQCYPKYIGGRSTIEYRKAVKPVCRLHNRYTSAQKLDDKTQGFYRISTCQENTL